MTFEETERRRAAQLSGPKERKRLGRALFALFLILTLALIYLIAAPYTGELGDDYAATAGVGGLGGLILLGIRYISYRRAHAPPASLSLAVLDVLAWIGVVGVLVWSFVFPALHAFPAGTILYLFYLPQFPIGVYSLTFIWAMLIVLRVVLQPFTKPPSERVYADIESSLRKLTDTVNQVGNTMRGTDQKVDPALVDKVSSIMSEITAVRKELSNIKTTGPAAFAAQPNVSSLRVVAPQAKQAVVPREQVAVARPEPAAAAAPDAGVSVPDSTVDNPWLDVLTKRRKKE
ncbi:MAG: hypothetical protein JRN08_07490 [Nitrososphaerota archaeon]|nr:hypothetical protein [Nitrososphaerota archaeon]